MNVDTVSLPFSSFPKVFVYLVDLLKEAAFSSFDSLHHSLCFYLVDLGPEFDYFLPSTPLGFDCFFLL